MVSKNDFAIITIVLGGVFGVSAFFLDSEKAVEGFVPSISDAFLVFSYFQTLLDVVTQSVSTMFATLAVILVLVVVALAIYLKTTPKWFRFEADTDRYS